MKSRLVILFFIAVSVYIVFNREQYKETIYHWDAAGYYVYLPAMFIYHDLGNFGFYAQVNHKYNLTGPADDYGLFGQPTGHLNNKYAIGTAVFELPFFFIAHWYCLTTHSYDADGYTTPYQFAGIFSCIFWVGVGLFFLRRLLQKYYSDNIAAFTLLCIAFGTNIYCYEAFSIGMSHPYGFFAVCGVLYFTDALYSRKNKGSFYWLAVFLGLVFIIRPVNILVVVIPLLW